VSAEIVEKDLSYAVVGAAMEVHRKLGPGLKEYFYHRGLREKLHGLGIDARYKAKGRLAHRGQFADGFEADIVVENAIVLELKHLDGTFTPEHFAQIISYQKFWNLRLGILLDFGKECLVQQRVLYTAPTLSPDPRTICTDQPYDENDSELFQVICESFCEVGRQFGLGYRNTTYKSLVRIEMLSRGLDVHTPMAGIGIDESEIGTTDLNCFLINERSLVRVHALQAELRAADRAILQSYLSHLQLGWGLMVNFGKKEFEVRLVQVS